MEERTPSGPGPALAPRKRGPAGGSGTPAFPGGRLSRAPPRASGGVMRRPSRSTAPRQSPAWPSCHRRIDTLALPAPAAGAARRSSRNAGRSRRSTKPTANVKPPTNTKERTTNVKRVMARPSHLDPRHPPDQREADDLQHEAPADQHRSARRLDERVEVAGGDEVEDDREGDGAEADEVRRIALLRRQDEGMAQQLESLADRVAKTAHDRREVATRRALDVDGGAEERDVLAGHPGLQSAQGLRRIETEPDLLPPLPELLAYRVRHLLAHELDGARQRVPGSHGARDHEPS